MDWRSLRRIVTDNAGNGRSRVLIDGEAARLLAIEETGLAEIWTAPLEAGRLLGAIDRLADEDVRLEPDRGAVKVR